KKMGQQVRQWRIHTRTGHDLNEIAALVNPVVAGRVEYYRPVLPAQPDSPPPRGNTHLIPRAGQEEQPVPPPQRVLRWWCGVTEREPRLFAHWAWTHELAGLRREERSEPRGSRSVLWEPGGAIPPGDPTRTCATWCGSACPAPAAGARGGPPAATSAA